MDGAAEKVLTRKIGLGGVGRSPIPDVERLGDVFARELENALRPILLTGVAGMILEGEVTKLAAVAEAIPVPALLGVLSFPGCDHHGMINVSADLVYHIVDLRMGGDAGTCPTPTTRSLTAIDYALCEGVLKQTIFAFERAIEIILDGPLTGHFNHIDTAQNITNVTIAPETADVLKYTVSLDIGVAARGGDLDIIVPLSVLDVVRASIEPRKPDQSETVKDIWRDRMRQAVHEATLPLTAILTRGKFNADFLNDLKVGQVVPIPSNAPQQVELVLNAEKKDAFKVTDARLGAFEGKKVLKLNEAADPQVLRHINSAVSED